MNFKTWLEASTMFHAANFTEDQKKFLLMYAQKQIKIPIYVSGDIRLSIDVHRPNSFVNDLFWLDYSGETINLPFHNSLMNPAVVSKMEAIGKLGVFDGWQVLSGGVRTPLRELLGRVRNVSGVTRTFAKDKDEHRSSERRFVSRVIEEVWEKDWYHATLESNVESIMRDGLKPSDRLKDMMAAKKTNSLLVSDIPMRGFSGLNFDIQKAVYLYNNQDSAVNLAHGLTHKNGESAVVLKVSGQALKDYSKLLPDEDEFRQDMSAPVDYRMNTGVPAFLKSGTGHIRALSYAGVIPPQYLEVFKTIKFDDENDDENDYEN